MKRFAFALALLGTGIGIGVSAGSAAAQGTYSLVASSRPGVSDQQALTDMAGPVQAVLPGAPVKLIGPGAQATDSQTGYFGRTSHGVTTRAAYSMAGSGVGLGAGERHNRAWGISLAFEQGPLTVRAAHQNLRSSQIAPGLPISHRMDAKNTILALNLQVGPGTAYAGYSANRGSGSSPLWNPGNPYSAAIAASPSTNSRDMLIGFAMPKGATTLLASFIRKSDRDLAHLDADQLAFGATHAISRRTDLYVSYSLIKQHQGTVLLAGGGATIRPNSAGLNLGMRHAF